MMERRFPRVVGSLHAIFAFVDEFFERHRLDRERAFDAHLVLEELFTNMVRHAREGREPIWIGLETSGGRLVLVLRDSGVDRFDPTLAPEIDVDASLDERKPGGLGIHFVRRIAEDVRYEYHDRTATLTVVMKVAPPPSPS